MQCVEGRCILTPSRRYYNAKVRNQTFKVGDLVHKQIFTIENLGPAWEGPYTIEKMLGDGIFRLATTDEIPLLRAWSSKAYDAISLKNKFINNWLELCNKTYYVISHLLWNKMASRVQDSAFPLPKSCDLTLETKSKSEGRTGELAKNQNRLQLPLKSKPIYTK